MTIAVFTHKRAEDTAAPLRRLIDAAGEAGEEILLSRGEAEKHGIGENAGVTVVDDPAGETDLALVLGGDGTILATLRLFAGTGVPTFAINFGAIGFLATVEPTDLDEGLRLAFERRFDTMGLPALVASTSEGDEVAMNDISFHRRQNGRVAELAYSVGGEELGEVRCDGLVVSTPAGSTGYNLANGGPVLAWGVEGYVVSFIAPHTLTAREIVVAPADVLTVTNRSRGEDVDMTTDGQPVCALPKEGSMDIRFDPGRALLAQLPGASFYHRFRDKFGRLAY